MFMACAAAGNFFPRIIIPKYIGNLVEVNEFEVLV